MQRILATFGFALLLAHAASTQSPPRVQVVPHPVAPRVDVLVDGQPFTSYVYERSHKKPFLYPIRSASGVVVTRGYPLEPRPGERPDHPHQIGLWLNYGDVNGLDFWNNSDAVPAGRAAKMGSIVHKRVIEAKSGQHSAELNVEADWVDPQEAVLLRENTRYVFSAEGRARAIDRITRLAALNRPVVLGDNKEGFLGLRVARALEQPTTSPEVFLDASLKPAAKAVNNEGVSGQYVGSDGKTGDAVWGTRGPWLMLAGRIDGRAVTLAMFDHSANPGYPTYWHARGYGLFAANNLGQKVFDPAQPEARRTIGPNDSLTFRHRVLVLEGNATAAEMTAEHRRFVEQRQP